MVKKNFILLISFLFFIGCKKSDAQTLSDKKQKSEINTSKIVGIWEYIDNSNKKDIPNEIFTLNIKNYKNDSITAQYCAIEDRGNKIDCSNEENNNVKGIIKGHKIYLSFNSFFEGKDGKAEIEIHNEYLLWKVTKSPIGKYYAPSQAKLYKKEKKVQENIQDNKATVNSEANIILPISKDDLLNPDIQFPIIDKKIIIEGSEASSVYKLANNTFLLWFDGDNERWYVVTFVNNQLFNKLLIGKSETIESENGKIIDNYIDFNIDKNLKIKLKYSTGKKIKKIESYQINDQTGIIEKLL
ncbi:MULTISPECIES: hypothetical protein [unclassified Chryseobacterium]|uniref:hypothetical protein n=1 Tax=unclassified Chryseobacterium TaxID=2593645 RepID=UPI000F4527B2|nr:hypothetical protein [Chryseobacterium sp. G0240]ROI03570.1 hypothetical protein EGI16_11410 [Chryseobacterium sp. G0240]